MSELNERQIRALVRLKPGSVNTLNMVSSQERATLKALRSRGYVRLAYHSTRALRVALTRTGIERRASAIESHKGELLR